jgi:hypothetical protein
MGRIKSFKEFINETFLEQPADVDILDHDKKKMKKNGYSEVTVIESEDGLKKGDKVLVSATEFGQLEDESYVTCYKDDEKFIVQKKNLQVNV